MVALRLFHFILCNVGYLIPSRCAGQNAEASHPVIMDPAFDYPARCSTLLTPSWLSPVSPTYNVRTVYPDKGITSVVHCEGKTRKDFRCYSVGT